MHVARKSRTYTYLILTLRYLVAWDASSYPVNHTNISRIIRDTTSVIWTILSGRGYLSSPFIQEKWVQNSTVILSTSVRKAYPYYFDAIPVSNFVL